MSVNTNMNMNHTKAQMLAAIEYLKQELAQKKNSNFDPMDELKNKKNSEILKSTDAVDEANVTTKLSNVQKELSEFLTKLSEDFSSEILQLNNIKEAIKIKEKELEDLFGVEKQLFSLVDLINTNKDMEKKLKDSFDELKQSLEIEKQNLIKSNNSLKESLILERQREKEEYEYNFDRKKIQDINDLNDILAQKKKDCNESIQKSYAELAIKKDEYNKLNKQLQDQKSHYDELESQIGDMDAIIEEAVEKAVKNALELADEKNQLKEQSIIDKYESKWDIERNTISLLQSKEKELMAKNNELQQKLDNAYEKIQTMAIETVKGSSNSKNLEEIEKLIDKKIAYK